MPLTCHVCQACLCGLDTPPLSQQRRFLPSSSSLQCQSPPSPGRCGHFPAQFPPVKTSAATRSVACCCLGPLQFWAMHHPALCSLHSAVVSSKMEGRGTSCSCYPRWFPSCDSACGFFSSSSPLCSIPVPAHGPSSSRRFAPITHPPAHRARPSAPSPDQPAQSPAAIRVRGQLLRSFGSLAAPSRLCPDARGHFDHNCLTVFICFIFWHGTKHQHFVPTMGDKKLSAQPRSPDVQSGPTFGF